MTDEHKPLAAEEIDALKHFCGATASVATWALLRAIATIEARDAEIERLHTALENGVSKFQKENLRAEQAERKQAAVREWAERTGANYAASHERRMGYNAAQGHVQNLLNTTITPTPAPQWTSEPPTDLNPDGCRRFWRSGPGKRPQPMYIERSGHKPPYWTSWGECLGNCDQETNAVSLNLNYTGDGPIEDGYEDTYPLRGGEWHSRPITEPGGG